MKLRNVKRILTRALLLLVVLILASEPVLVAAQPRPQPQADAVDVMLEAGDRYLTSSAGMLGSAVILLDQVDAINSTSVEALSEETIEATREESRALATQAAQAIGAVDDLADSIEAFDDSYFAAADLSAEAAGGLPEQLATDLLTQAGLSPSQVQRVEAAYGDLAARRLGFSALPAEVRSNLGAAGLSSAEIDRIESELADRGVADGAIPDALVQLRASQAELASARTRALMLDSQLLARQVAARQADGVAPRAVTEDELEALANDELRLLIHVAQLQELWGEEPDLDVGEGHWWFIERYAARAAERIEAITLDSQNLALIPELFLVRSLAQAARAARAGDADFAKRELDQFVELLLVEIGDEDFVDRQRDSVAGVTKVLARLAGHEDLRQVVSWPVRPADRAAYVEHARARLEGQGVRDLVAVIGAIEEQNELNNELGFLFAAGLPYFKQLASDVLLTSLDVIAFINDGDIVRWLTAILTGETDDPALLVGSVLFSLIPVLGVLPDIYDLVFRPSVVIKAISLIGIVGGIVELASFIPGLQPAGVGGALGKATATVLKGLQSAAEAAFPLFRGVMRSLGLREAFDLMGGLVRVTLRGVSEFPSSFDEIAQFVGDLLTGTRRLWDNFIHFVQRAGADLLVRMGFDEGSALIGEIVRRGGTLSDDVLPVVDDVGQGVAREGRVIADEAADGMGVLARNLESTRLRRTLENIGGACGVAAVPAARAKLARVRAERLCDPDLLVNVLRSADEWDEAVIAGVRRLERIDGAELGTLLARYHDSPEHLQESLRVIGRYDFTGWDSSTVSKLTNYISKTGGDDTVEFMLNEMLTGDVDNLFNVQFGRMLDRLGDDDLLRRMLRNDVSDDIRDGLLSTIRRAEHPNTPFWAKHGANFQIHRGKHYFSSEQIVSFEQSRLDLTLLTTNGPIIEAKYWSRNRVLEDLADPSRSILVRQVSERVLTGRPVILEFGATVSEPPVGVNTIRTVREVLDEAGINLDNVSFAIVDSHLFAGP